MATSPLADRPAILTGASSGIGAALARELARRGMKVGLLARREERLRQVADDIRAAGGTAAWAVADVTEREQLFAACDALTAELGGPDLVVANAGYALVEKPSDVEVGAARALYDTNVGGMLDLFDWAIPRLVERGSGHLAGMSSVASYLGLPGTASYCGSKAAQRIHLQALRVTLARRGIAVTTICPGFVESELTAGSKLPMPFMMETDRAARIIADALEGRRREIVFPWQMKLLTLAARWLPLPILERLLQRGGGRRS